MRIVLVSHVVQQIGQDVKVDNVLDVDLVFGKLLAQQNQSLMVLKSRNCCLHLVRGDA